MSLTPGIANFYFNIKTGFIKVVDGTSGTAFVKGVLKITGPDSNLYYSPGNNSSTFAAPATSASPDFTAIGGINTAIAIPLNTGGFPMTGIYKVDYKITDGATIYTYSGALTTGVVDYQFSNPTTLSLGLTMNTSLPAAVFQDNSSYTISGITPTITRSSTLTKNNDTPAFTPIVFIAASYSLIGTFYAGLYTLVTVSELTYDFTNFGVITEVTITNNTLDVEGYNGPKSISCAQNQLITQMEAAYSAGNTTIGDSIKNTLLFLGIYLNQYEWAIRANNDTVRDSAMVKIMNLANVSSACCGSDPNYQILSTSLCECDLYVEAPESYTSTTDSNGNAYKIGDRSFDGTYEYVYIANATFPRSSALKPW